MYGNVTVVCDCGSTFPSGTSSYLGNDEDTRMRINLEFGGGYSMLKEPISEVQHQPDSGRYTTQANGDGSPE